MKTCSKCSTTKPISEYFVKDKKSGRLHAQCKDCYKEHRKTFYTNHYAKYGDLYRKRAQARRIMLRQEYRTNMLAYLSGKACIICGENDLRVLEFDHINPSEKLFSISQAVKLGYSWPAVEIEIGKCRILCANCHKKQTAHQANWYKSI